MEYLGNGSRKTIALRVEPESENDKTEAILGRSKTNISKMPGVTSWLPVMKVAPQSGSASRPET